jgi:hypothetical protein
MPNYDGVGGDGQQQAFWNAQWQVEAINAQRQEQARTNELLQQQIAMAKYDPDPEPPFPQRDDFGKRRIGEGASDIPIAVGGVAYSLGVAGFALAALSNGSSLLSGIVSGMVICAIPAFIIMLVTAMFLPAGPPPEYEWNESDEEFNARFADFEQARLSWEVRKGYRCGHCGAPDTNHVHVY